MSWRLFHPLYMPKTFQLFLQFVVSHKVFKYLTPSNVFICHFLSLSFRYHSAEKIRKLKYFPNVLNYKNLFSITMSFLLKLFLSLIGESSMSCFDILLLGRNILYSVLCIFSMIRSWFCLPMHRDLLIFIFYPTTCSPQYVIMSYGLDHRRWADHRQ